jgi:hypothetical protein
VLTSGDFHEKLTPVLRTLQTGLVTLNPVQTRRKITANRPTPLARLLHRCWISSDNAP